MPQGAIAGSPKKQPVVSERILVKLIVHNTYEAFKK